MAIGRLIGPGSGQAPADHEPFSALQVTRPGTARLAEGGRLSQDREDVITAVVSASGMLTLLAGFDGLLGLDPPSVNDHVIEAGTALGAFRDQVARLLQVAHAPGGLTGKQRAELTAAGVRLPEPPPAAAGGGPGDAAGAGTDSARSTVYEAIAGAIRGGDTLPQVTRHLNQTAERAGAGRQRQLPARSRPGVPAGAGEPADGAAVTTAAAALVAAGGGSSGGRARRAGRPLERRRRGGRGRAGPGDGGGGRRPGRGERRSANSSAGWPWTMQCAPPTRWPTWSPP